MATLYAMATTHAAPDANVEPADHHARNRQFFLILGRDTGSPHVAAASRAVRWKGHLAAFVDARGWLTARFPAIPKTRLTARALRMLLQWLRERGCPVESGASCFVELSFEMVDLTAKPFPFALQVVALTSQRIALALRFLRALAPVDLVTIVVGAWRLWHTTVMPEFSVGYKTP